MDTCTPYSLETSKIVSVARNNTIASSLYRKWDYAKYRVGKYERNWTDGVGQVILTHPDGKELTREHVEVLYASSEAACELVGGNQDPYSPQIKKKEFEEYFTPRNFEHFWHLYSMDKLNEPTWSRRTPQLDIKGAEIDNTQLGESMYKRWRKITKDMPTANPPEIEFSDWEYVESKKAWKLRPEAKDRLRGE